MSDSAGSRARDVRGGLARQLLLKKSIAVIIEGVSSDIQGFESRKAHHTQPSADQLTADAGGPRYVPAETSRRIEDSTASSIQRGVFNAMRSMSCDINNYFIPSISLRISVRWLQLIDQEIFHGVRTLAFLFSIPVSNFPTVI